MKNESLYNKTVDILVQAYFNDTLMHNTCSACAVGNIIAAAHESMVIIDNDNPRGEWVPKKQFLWSNVLQLGNIVSYNDSIITQMEKTGYSIRELAKIEKAFESAPAKNRSDKSEEWMFNGLMAVIEVLDEIHENDNSQVTEVVKKRFVKTS